MKKYLEIFDLSNLIDMKTGFFSVIGAGVSTFLATIYGGEVRLTIIGLLALSITLDWLGAIAAAKKDGSYSSQYGILGILRTAVIITLPVWGNLVDKALGSQGFFFFLLTFGLLYHTSVSMTANFSRAGWDKWIPTWALKLITSEIEAKIKRSQSRKGDDSNG